MMMGVMVSSTRYGTAGSTSLLEGEVLAVYFVAVWRASDTFLEHSRVDVGGILSFDNIRVRDLTVVLDWLSSCGGQTIRRVCRLVL